MAGHSEQRFDLSAAKATAIVVAGEWGLELGEPFDEVDGDVDLAHTRAPRGGAGGPRT